MGNKEQVYSIDGSNYITWENIMDDLRESYDEGESVEVWEADKLECKHFHYIYAKDLIDAMQTRAMDECGEFADDYLDDLEDWKKADLEQCIAEWFDKNANIDFFAVENEHKTVVVVE